MMFRSVWLSCLLCVIFALKAHAQNPAALSRLESVRMCDQFSGVDAGARIAACIADLPATGGTADARGFEGSQTINSDPFTGVTKPVTLILGAATFSVGATTTVVASVSLKAEQGAIIKPINGSTFTISGGFEGTLSQHFDLSQSKKFFFGGTSPVPELYPEWWGAKHDNATDNSAAFQAAFDAAKAGGKAVKISAGSCYFQGSTGLVVNGAVRFYSPSGVATLCWDASFAGTALTVGSDHSGYNTVENIALFMPKSVTVPNRNIVCIDVVSALNRLINVRCDQTARGDNPPWYTGVRIGDISNSVLQPHIYAYNVGLMDYTAAGGSGSANDLEVADGEVTAHAGGLASILIAWSGSIHIHGVDLEGGATYNLRIVSTTQEIAGGLIEGNYGERATRACISVAGNGAFPVRGLTLVGNEINCAAGTTAMEFSNTIGLTVRGGYNVGKSNHVEFTGFNSNVDYSPGYTSGAFNASGAFTPIFDAQVGTWTPSVGGNATYTTQEGFWAKVGKQVTIHCSLTIKSLGTGSATTIVGVPFAARVGRSFGGGLSSFGSLAANYVYVAANLQGSNITFNTTSIPAVSMSGSSAILADNSTIQFTLTYFTD